MWKCFEGSKIEIVLRVKVVRVSIIVSRIVVPRRLPQTVFPVPDQDCVTAGDHVTPQVCQTFFRKREPKLYEISSGETSLL